MNRLKILTKNLSLNANYTWMEAVESGAVLCGEERRRGRGEDDHGEKNIDKNKKNIIGRTLDKNSKKSLYRDTKKSTNKNSARSTTAAGSTTNTDRCVRATGSGGGTGWGMVIEF